jgi:hypothetical protein
VLYGLLKNNVLRVIHSKYCLKSSHNIFNCNNNDCHTEKKNLIRRYANNFNFDGNCLNFNNSYLFDHQPKQLNQLNEIVALISDNNSSITDTITTTISSSCSSRSSSRSSSSSSSNSSTTITMPTRFSVEQLSLKLSQTGQSGLLAYGILNCLYYTSMTAIVWIYQSKSVIIPSASSSSSSSMLLFTSIIKKTILKLSKIILIVWAGSQITKIFRLFLSIALAPFIDNLIEYILSKYEIFKIKNRNHVIYYIITLLWLFTLSFYFILIFSSSIIEWLN